MMPGPLQVALVQASPVHVNLEATMDKVEALARDAAAQGAQLVVFGETFITGYPAWIDSSPGAALWDHEATKEAYARLVNVASPLVGGGHTDNAHLATTPGTRPDATFYASCPRRHCTRLK